MIGCSAEHIKAIKRLIKKDMLTYLIYGCKAMDRKNLTVEISKLDISGYSKETKEFTHFIHHSLENEYRFLYEVKVNDRSYGYKHPDFDDELITEINGSTFRLKESSISAYKRTVELAMNITGDPDDFYNVHIFKMELEVTGIESRFEKAFWQESLCTMYHLYTIGNLKGAFMNAFIALEGYLRVIMNNTNTPFQRLYESLIGASYEQKQAQKLIKKIPQLARMRNAIMHGHGSDVEKKHIEDVLLQLAYIHDIKR
ncbi:hypothetical protein ACQKJC_22665 [Priestia koreensis]|uniref:hypothetical protein n=1 Tax=Priestia koreensis TaxID=284581 RepID=UPI003D04AE6F